MMSREIPKVKLGPEAYCYNLDRSYKCMAYTRSDCREDCPARVGSLRQLLKLYRSLMPRALPPDRAYYEDQIEVIKQELTIEEDRQIRAAYNEDMHRGSRGGSSESDSNKRAGLKQMMKDNRPQACKWTHAQRQEIKELTEEWEAEHGKLPKLSRSMLSKGKKEDK